MTERIPVVVLGATGYVSGEVLRLVATHPAFELAAAVSESRAGDPVGAVFPHLAAAMAGRTFAAYGDWSDTIGAGSRLAIFSAAPHGASARLVDEALEVAARKDLDAHVVDVSADFRYATADAFEAVYGQAHGAPGRLGDFACALPEHETGTPSAHIGHPGCFATAALLAAVPLLDSGLAADELFISGVTGSTGSGRAPQPGTHHPERHSNLYAYKPLEHRHAPEIATLSKRATGVRATINFVPHSGPFARGIYVTVQARAAADANDAALREAFEAAYGAAPFVDVVAGMPKLKNVVASNRAEIGIALGAGAVVVTCAIDNLVKGAAGGAVQWMNRLFDLPETAGLEAPAPGWT